MNDRTGGKKRGILVVALCALVAAWFVAPANAGVTPPDYCIDFIKTGPEESVVPGDEVVYSFTAINNCSFPLRSGIQCYDAFLGGLIWDNELEVGETKSFTKNHIVTAEDCRADQFTNEAWCRDGTGAATSEIASWTVFCATCDPSGTGTPGYWKNHPEAWPVEVITVGGIEYSKALAIEIMDGPVQGDKTVTLFKALVAAMLNVKDCNDGNCVKQTIMMADTWMATYGPVGSGVKASSIAWVQGEPLYETLDNYNNGMLCAPSRDGLE